MQSEFYISESNHQFSLKNNNAPLVITHAAI
jgi:hypothetical protein